MISQKSTKSGKVTQVPILPKVKVSDIEAGNAPSVLKQKFSVT